jgi:hypothetical protein
MINRHRITITSEELAILQLYLHHSLDWMYGDNRPDHGLAKMQEFKPHVLVLQNIHKKLYRMRMKQR